MEWLGRFITNERIRADISHDRRTKYVCDIAECRQEFLTTDAALRHKEDHDHKFIEVLRASVGDHVASYTYRVNFERTPSFSEVMFDLFVPQLPEHHGIFISDHSIVTFKDCHHVDYGMMSNPAEIAVESMAVDEFRANPEQKIYLEGHSSGADAVAARMIGKTGYCFYQWNCLDFANFCMDFPNADTVFRSAHLISAAMGDPIFPFGHVALAAAAPVRRFLALDPSTEILHGPLCFEHRHLCEGYNVEAVELERCAVHVDCMYFICSVKDCWNVWTNDEEDTRSAEIDRNNPGQIDHSQG